MAPWAIITLLPMETNPFLRRDTIFLNTRSTTNAYFPEITAQYGACPDKTIVCYLDITDDCCLRMNIGGFGDFWNFVFEFID
jgi:hypothetical protein